MKKASTGRMKVFLPTEIIGRITDFLTPPESLLDFMDHLRQRLGFTVRMAIISPAGAYGHHLRHATVRALTVKGFKHAFMQLWKWSTCQMKVERELNNIFIKL